jgi:hypothetical protein
MIQVSLIIPYRGSCYYMQQHALHQSRGTEPIAMPARLPSPSYTNNTTHYTLPPPQNNAPASAAWMACACRRGQTSLPGT